MISKPLRAIFLLVIILGVILFGFITNSTIDYNKIYSKFYEDDLAGFLENNEIELEKNLIKEYHIIDLKNTGESQLIILYGEHNVENIVVSYKHGEFLLDEPIDLFTNVGSGGSEYKMLMSKDNKVYYYTYKSNRLEYGENSSWSIKSQIFTYEDNEKIMIEEMICENGKDYFLNGKKLTGKHYDYGPTEKYNILIDSRDFVIK